MYIIIYLKVVSLFKKKHNFYIHVLFYNKMCKDITTLLPFYFSCGDAQCFSTSLPTITIIVIAFIDHCLINGLCFMNSQSNESNPCQLCNSSQSNDSWTDNPGAFTLLTYQSLVMDIFSFNDFFNPRISYVEEVK